MRKRKDLTEIGRPFLKGDQRGMVMVVTLLIMVILVIMGSVLIVTSFTEHQISSNDVAAVQALYVSEGGIQTVLNDLDKGLSPSTSGTIGAGQFTASVTAADPPAGQKRVEAYGYVPNQASARGVKGISVLVYRKSPFQWGAWGDTGVTISGGGITDSYDSDIGTYGGTYNGVANVGSDGDVGSNGNITFSGGGTQVRGDATISGGTITTPATYVTGTATTGAPSVTLASVDCPAGGYTPPADSNGDLKVSGGDNITLSDLGPYYFRDVILSGSSTLTLSSTGHVDIYISRKLDLSGGGINNTDALPTSLSIWGCGTETSDWSLSGGSGSCFAVYAPYHKCAISGAGDLWGSVIGKEVTSSDGSKIHYDEALARRPGIGKYMVVPRSWTELSP